MIEIGLGADDAALLALLNSAPIIDGAVRDALGDDESARAWLRAYAPDVPATDRQLLRAARDALRAVVRGEQPPESLTPLLDGVRPRPEISGTGLRWTLDVDGGRAVVVRALLTWDALVRTSPGRLRPCTNDECALFLIDRSKANNARWCSMATCGNKMKARRHYERSRRPRPAGS
jgi:hypothetical protein